MTGILSARITLLAALLSTSLLVTACSKADATLGDKRSPQDEAAQGPSLQTGRVSLGEIAKIINATGTVRPDITVQVGSEVSGKLLSVDVDFNSVVKKGDVLAVIDPENLENRVAQVEASVSNRQAEIRINQASLKRTEINAAQSKRSLERRSQLFAENAISKAQLEETERAMLIADADIELAQARLNGSQSSLRSAQADLRSARVDLSRTVIRAPVDGVVIERLVDPGQTVAASFSAPELFKIAGDLSKIKIDAAIVESDVSGLDAGDPVSFSVDAYPGRVFRGKIDQLRLKSTTQSNIVTYTAVVDAANADGVLMPGMTTNLQITTNSKTGILRIPATAERFRPTPDQIKKWATTETEAGNADVDPKTRERMNALGLAKPRIDNLMSAMARDTEKLREQINDPTQTWRKVSRMKQLRETYDGIIKKELSSTEYQDYRRLLQANAQTRDAQLWIKSGDKMKQVDVGLGLSDGSYVEVISGLSENDAVITAIGSGGARRGPPRGRPG
ncbi:MAG: efflux RND transporter periplasmic adaptor subunit [Hellea sp.]